jgi:translation initiation factor 2B subunit (eIF-2B alpha/beta/delta family)
LETRKDAGTLNLDRKTLISLREVLQNADLVKFAKSMPEYRIANEDRKVVENVVIQTREALPEPTEEELHKQAAYQEYQAKKAKKRKVDLGTFWRWNLRLISFGH